MVKYFYIDKNYHDLVRSAAVPMTKDSSGVGESLFKIMRELAYEYESKTRQRIDYEITDEELLEVQQKFLLARDNFVKWIDSQPK